jgi:hypothetical protein
MTMIDLLDRISGRSTTRDQRRERAGGNTKSHAADLVDIGKEPPTVWAIQDLRNHQRRYEALRRDHHYNYDASSSLSADDAERRRLTGRGDH